MLGGTIITLMTWMERSTDSVPAKLIAAVSAAFLLGAGALVHAIVVSLVMFAALHAGAPFGYLDWLGTLAWATAGNIVGGLGLVTMLRLVQVGRGTVADERAARGQPGRPGHERPALGAEAPASGEGRESAGPVRHTG